MFLSIAAAVALSLQPEAGAVHMPGAPDDFWYEQGLPHTTDFDSFAFGLGLRADVTRHLQLTLGWRNLGNQHQHGQIMEDRAYFACAPHGNCIGHAVNWWDETGSTQQTYFSAGYSFHLARQWIVVPEAGIARTTLSSHVNKYLLPDLRLIHQNCRTGRESHLTAFYGVSAQRGPFGIGVELLDTGVDRSGNDCTSPIQGSTIAYLRVTYAFGILGAR